MRIMYQMTNFQQSFKVREVYEIILNMQAFHNCILAYNGEILVLLKMYWLRHFYHTVKWSDQKQWNVINQLF